MVISIITFNKDCIPHEVINILDKIEQNGYKSYLVGGCLRDFIYGYIPNDWDITTDASLKELLELFKDEVQQYNTNNKSHETITFKYNVNNIEITTFKNGCKDIFEDISKRDFTCNAIAYSYSSDSLIDIYESIDNIKNKKIKFVNNPVDRIKEDPLRILRAFRFQSKYGWNIDDKDLDSIITNKFLLKGISAERIKSELDKILLGSFINKLDNFYFDSILSFILPEINDDLANREYKKALYIAIPNLIVKWSLLLQNVSIDNIKEICSRLRFDTDSTKDILRVMYNKDFFETNEVTIQSVRKLMSILDIDSILNLLQFLQAKYSSLDVVKENNISKIYDTYKLIVKIKENHDCISLKDMSVKGNDLIEFGYKGKEIGKALNFLLNSIMEDKIENDKDGLLMWLQVNDAIKDI